MNIIRGTDVIIVLDGGDVMPIYLPGMDCKIGYTVVTNRSSGTSPQFSFPPALV